MTHLYRNSSVYAQKMPMQTQEISSSISKTVQPNSAVAALLGLADHHDHSSLDVAMKAKLAALCGQHPSAEQEAERLSAGTTAKTPDQLKLEMGRRLNANFSSVRFHSDKQSVEIANLIGARAWTQGSDVYFGEGGFDPDIAAHELVHTVQQGGVAGNVSEAVPVGDIQMCPLPKLRSSTQGKETHKAPYEVTSKQLMMNKFNPCNIPKIGEVQGKIDAARTIEEAYKAFYDFSHTDSSLNAPFPILEGHKKNAGNLDLNLFKNKLKNMTRIVYDYPELKNCIGTFHFDYVEPCLNRAFVMKTHFPNIYSHNRLVSDLTYNTYFDQRTYKVSNVKPKNAQSFLSADRSYSGVHELAHILNHQLALSRYMTKAAKQVLPMPPKFPLPPLKSRWSAENRTLSYESSSKGEDILTLANDDLMRSRKSSALRNQALVSIKSILPADKKNPKKIEEALNKEGITSTYGKTSAAEFFAEAFADVYAHGDHASSASIELVKLYESQRDTYKAERLKEYFRKYG